MVAWPKRFEGVVQFTRNLIHRNFLKALHIRDHLVLSEEAFHLLMAGIVGLMGGIIDVLFYLSIEGVQRLLLGHPGQTIVQVAQELSPFWRFLTPVLGGLAAGAVLFWGLKLAGKERSTNLLEVVVAGDGRLPFRLGVMRTVSSLISIGTGASIGREGGITQLSATVASKWGQLQGWQPYRLRLLVACGAAAGMAAAYNAPITGAIFAAHIVLGNFSMNLFAPLLCASVVSSMLSRSFFGIHLWYEVPSHDFTSITQLFWFVIVGFFAGVLGAAFLKLMKYSREVFKQVPKLYLRLGTGGLLIGAIALWFPEVWGNGYELANQMIQTPMKFDTLLGIFFAKLVATVISVGSGAVGGVITPTLFLGASLGSLFGTVLQFGGLAPANVPIGIFALVGMGSMFAATTRSPLLAIVMILEISQNYSLMPALMLACAISTLVSRGLHANSVYTEPLRQRTLEMETSRLGAATEQTIGDMMRAPVVPVRETATLPEIANRFLTGSNNFLPVVDVDYRLMGVVALQDVKEYLGAGSELTAVIAWDLMRPIPPCLKPDQKLMDALPTLLASDQRNVPVVNTFDEKRLVGSVLRAEALAALSEAIASSTATTSSTETAAAKERQAPASATAATAPPAPASATAK